MTPEDHNWAQAYLLGQSSITLTDNGPECTQDALFGLVNLAKHVRNITRNASTPYELALRRLTFCTDDMLATILAPGDDDADAAITQAWKDARQELESLR